MYMFSFSLQLALYLFFFSIVSLCLLLKKTGHYSVFYLSFFVLFVDEFTLAAVCHRFDIIRLDGYSVQVTTMAKQTMHLCQ